MSDVFENRDMAGTTFRRLNLGGATFDDVNLGETTFHNVNLSGAVIREANLGGLRIEGCAIRGLIVHGMDIYPLIEAELDRRDPQRASLRMRDPFDPSSVREVMARLEDLRARFRQTLYSVEPARLTARPKPEKWSAIENVRHLVFAEDMYLNRWLLRNDRPWTKLGLLPSFLADNPAFAEVSRQPSGNLEEILAAWDEIHAGMRAFLADLTADVLRRDTSDVDFGQRTVGGILQGMALHDLHHIQLAEEALQKLAVT
ncbi:MAG: DinB family protein [Anaerolineae bacterium]|nr:DinB family protein [Anaerolineae bacterium]